VIAFVGVSQVILTLIHGSVIAEFSVFSEEVLLKTCLQIQSSMKQPSLNIRMEHSASLTPHVFRIRCKIQRVSLPWSWFQHSALFVL